MSDSHTFIGYLVEERAQRLKAFDDAYPDEGMPPGIEHFRQEAIGELKEEGLIPMDWEPEK